MSLVDLVKINKRTDKNTTHSYLPLYDELLLRKKYSSKNILEIGIGLPWENKTNGGSIKLWELYFENADIYAIDIISKDEVWTGITNNNRINLFTSQDAYNIDFINTNFSNKISFDFILDDGPHTYSSQVKCLKYYLDLLTDDGILIIEDVPNMERVEGLRKYVPKDLQKYIKIYDLRSVKNRYDDILFTVNKNL